MGETNKKPYSKELSDVLDYMVDILSNEFPTDMFTPEYLMVAILDVKKCHANCILDNYLMSENMNEIREIYTSVLNNTNHLPIKDSNEKADFDSELGRILEMAEVESDKLSTNEVGTEHVLLSILNPENNFRLSEVFRSVGIDYAFLFDRCQPTSASTKVQKKARPQRNRNFINSNGWNQNPQPQIIPLKSEINTTSTSESSEYVSKYTTNINELCNNGSIDKIIGRKREINQIIEILARRKKNNVILTGNAGVGKTSIVYSLAQLIENGEVPPILEKKQIVQLNIMALVSGTHFRGMFEERIKGLFDELKNSNKYILFIDDMQSVLKSTGKDKDTDISSMIGDILTEGKVRVIGTISFKDYRNSIEYNPAISHRLQKIVVEPTTVSETIEILNSSKKNYEDFHNVNYSDEVIKKCVELSERYISDRCLPDSAFDVMDMTGAYASLKKKASDEFMALKRRLYEIEEEKNEVLNHGDFEKVDAIIIEENDVNRRINEMKREASSDNNRINVTVDDLRRTISEMTNVPISRLSHDEKAKIATIDKTLKEHVIGQDEAVDEICRIIKRNKVGIGNNKKCMGAVLLCGKSGTGKTLVAKKIAEELFGDENSMIRIDMSEYSEKSSITKLHGCFTPEMNVLMSDGSYKKISDVQIGDEVITHTGNIKKVLNKFEYYIEEEINNFRVSNTNFKVRCTKGHNILAIKPFYYSNGRINKKTYNPKNASFIESEKLVENDILMYPKNIKINKKNSVFDLVSYLGEKNFYKFDDNFLYSTKEVKRFINLDDKFARLLGYYISEGGISKTYKCISFTFHIDETQYLNEVIRLMDEIFNIKTYKLRVKKERHAISVSFHSRIVCRFIANLCGRECHVKQLPLDILSADDKVKINLLETALYGDGTKCLVKQTKYTTVSLKLASQINTLFRSLGYSTQLVAEEHDNENYSTTYRVILTGKNVEKLNNEFPNLRIKSFECKPKNIQRKYWVDDEYYYYRINQKNSEFYTGLVYDLTIEDDSSYIVNGFSVHNSSPGYIGYDEGGILTNSIKNKPYSVVLLDEIEKADESIFNLFLQIFDEGHITESNGNSVNCKNCLFIMTSNIGARKAAELGAGVGFSTDAESNSKSIIDKELKKSFSPEFLNRIDKIVHFNDLTDDNLKDIVKLEINKFGSRLKKLKYDIKFDDSVVDFIHKESIKQKDFGARPIIRLVQTNLEDAVTDLMLKNDYEPEYVFSASCKEGQIVVV